MKSVKGVPDYVAGGTRADWMAHLRAVKAALQAKRKAAKARSDAKAKA